MSIYKFGVIGAALHLFKPLLLSICPSVRPSVRPSVHRFVRPLRLLIYPLIEMFRGTLCRVSGLVLETVTFNLQSYNKLVLVYILAKFLMLVIRNKVKTTYSSRWV